jgi:putative membrane protein
MPEAAIRDHLANERTLLAWQRTALATIGLGFVVDRLALDPVGTSSLAGPLLGVGLIGLGALAALLGVQRYLRVERQIDTASYRPSVGVHLLFTMVIVAGAAALALYLVLERPS